MPKREASIWDEFQGLELGDNRRAARAVRLATALAGNPTASLPELFRDSAELEAAYRLLNNDAVDLPKLIAPHVRETVARCENRDIIAAHDTTVFSYAAGGKRRGLSSNRGAQEFRCHATLAITADGARDPLGVLACETWVRDGSRDRSEARRWQEQAERVSALEGVDARRIVHVMDREADDYAMYVALKERGLRFVVRASIDRRLTNTHDGEHLRSAMARLPLTTTREVPVAARGKVGRGSVERKAFPPRIARVARLEITMARFAFPRPKSQDPSLPSTCELNVVRVVENGAPSGEEPIEWILYTTDPIETDANVLAIVDAYRARWRIEEFFKAVKTGCAFEERQLESYDSLTNALGITLPIAWRMLRLRSHAHEIPDAPASSLLDEDEIAVLRAEVPRAKLGRKPTLAAALACIAHIGGHLARNGAPGWQTLYRGLRNLESLVRGYRLASGKRRRKPGPDQS